MLFQKEINTRAHGKEIANLLDEKDLSERKKNHF